MKLTAAEFLTLDGVYQGPGSPDEDRRGGFDRGGWQAPIDDPEVGPFITATYEQMDAMLLGRRTWDIWSSYWPHNDWGDPVSLASTSCRNTCPRRRSRTRPGRTRT